MLRMAPVSARSQLNLVTVTITNAQSRLPVDQKRLRRAVRMILEDESIARAKIDVAVVDDRTIAELHRRYLDDPEPDRRAEFRAGTVAKIFRGRDRRQRRRRLRLGPELQLDCRG